jgi:hypothetical protein
MALSLFGVVTVVGCAAVVPLGVLATVFTGVHVSDVNKINPLRPSDLGSSPPPPLLPPRLRDLLATTSPSPPFLPNPKYKQPTQLQICGRLHMFHRKQTRRTRLHRGFDSEHLLPPATRSFYICQSLGAGFLSNSVGPSSTDARRGLSTLLFSPLAISQLTSGMFFTGSISVVSMWFRSKDPFVIRTSLKVRFVIWLLNI